MVPHILDDDELNIKLNTLGTCLPQGNQICYQHPHGLNGRTDELAKMLHRLLLTTQNASKADQLEVIIAPTLHDMLHHQLD